LKERRPVQLIYSVLIGAGCALCVYIPALLAVVPGILAFTWIAFGPFAFILAALPGIFAAFLSTDTLTAALLIFIWLPAAAVLAVFAVKRKPWRETLFYACAVLCLGYYLFMCLPSLMAGQPAFGGIVSAAETMSAELTDSFKAAGADAALLEEFSGNLDLITSAIPKVMLSFILAMGIFSGLISAVTAKALARKTNAGIRPMAKFELWQLPKGFLWGAIFMFAVALIGMLSGYIGFEAVYLAVITVILIPLAVQGLCFEFYLTGRRKNPALARTILFLAVVLLFPFSIAALELLGTLEQMLKVRIRLRDLNIR
jgi:uncharacterized protein YybS (DUF2232 family)